MFAVRPYMILHTLDMPDATLRGMFYTDYLKFRGYDVTYCRNVTDVDDKILKKAEKEGKTPTEVSQYWYKQFANSMKALNNLTPDIEPFATKTLGEMISIVKDLIANGYAYESNGDVYFRVKKFYKIRSIIKTTY